MKYFNFDFEKNKNSHFVQILMIFCLFYFELHFYHQWTEEFYFEVDIFSHIF